MRSLLEWLCYGAMGGWAVTSMAAEPMACPVVGPSPEPGARTVEVYVLNAFECPTRAGVLTLWDNEGRSWSCPVPVPEGMLSLRPADYALTAECGGLAAHTMLQRDDFPDSSRSSLLVELTLRPQGSLKVEGPAGAVVVAHRAGVFALNEGPAELGVGGFATLDGLLPGEWILTASRTGYEVYTAAVTVEQGKQASISLDLRPRPAALHLEGAPGEAVVTLVGPEGQQQSASRLPARLDGLGAGRWKLTVQRPGALEWSEEVDLAPGEVAELRVNSPAAAALELRGLPDKSQVLIAGPTHLQGSEALWEGLPAGVYSISVTHPRYDRMAVEGVQLQPGERRPIELTPRTRWDIRWGIGLSAAGLFVTAVSLGTWPYSQPIAADPHAPPLQKNVWVVVRSGYLYGIPIGLAGGLMYVNARF